MNAEFRTLLPLGWDGGEVFGGERHEDEDALQAEQAPARGRLHLLVTAELALVHLRDARDGQSPGEPLPLAARDEKITDLDFVARVDHLHFSGVALGVACAANEA